MSGVPAEPPSTPGLRRESTDVVAPVAAHETASSGLGSWLTTTDHRRIGLLYIGASLVFFVVAVSFAMMMRTQLIVPRNTFLSPEEYDQIFSMHGTTMVFLFAMPMLAGLANYFIPLQIGAQDMAFPRMNALSFWLFLFGGLLLYSSFLFGGALDTGWFSYAPLTSKAYSPHDGVTFWTVSLAMLGAASILGALNFIVTCLRFRAKGLGLWKMPIFTVATFINSFLILFAIPSLTAAVALLYLDRVYNTSFFDPAGGGDPVLWQHLFWFFGHPEVYILILPAFGIMSEVVPVFSRKALFGRESMIVMLGVIGFLGFLVWAHHMFATGLPTLFNVIMAGTSMLIAIPTGVKIFNWLATMWGGALRFTTSLLFACGLIALFTIGGITGVMQAAVPFDWQVEDTYWIVGHLHNVLIAGTVFAVFAGIYYWFPKVTGRMLSERVGKVQFWLTVIGFGLTFLPMYALGLMGMPRRVYTYAANVGWNVPNLISSIGGYILATAFLIFFYNVITSARRGEVAGDNPWRAWTLEWATSSPPPHGNFRRLPPITSERPLWDLEQAEAAGAATPPEAWTHLVPEPEQSTAAPLFVGLALLVVAAGLLSSLVVVAIGAVFLLVALGVWMNSHWTEPLSEPAGAHRFSFMGIGTLVFIGSESVFFGALIAGVIHLKVHATLTGPGTHLETTFPLINTVVIALSGVAGHYAQVMFRKGRRSSFILLLVLTIILGSAFLGGQIYEYSHTGFGLSTTLAASMFYVLTGFHGLHVICGLCVLVYLLVRTAREGRRTPGVSSAGTSGLVDGGTYYWHFVDAVWVAVFIVVYLL